MSRVKIITHSGSDLPADLAEKYDIEVIPDIVIFGETEYRGGRDITSEEFYKKLDESLRLPTSSHPSIGDFYDCFEKFGDYDEIVCITVTGKMSGTYTTARIAADSAVDEGKAKKVTVFDSEQVSYGMIFMLIKAGQMAKEGHTADEIIREMEGMKSRIGVYFVLGSLKNARKGGRVGAIRALAADTLGVKPLLMFDKGLVSDLAIARNFKQGLDLVANKYKALGDEGCEVYIFHSENSDGAHSLEERIEKINPAALCRTGYVGPVIGIYTGIGCVGCAFLKKQV